MENLIIIIISLILGFLQGIKKRNKKHSQEIKKLNADIQYLKNELEKRNRRQKLNQYAVKSHSFNGKEKLETDLMSYVSDSESKEILLLHSYYLIRYILDYSDYLSKENHLNIISLYSFIDENIFTTEVSETFINEKNISFESCCSDLKKFCNDFEITSYNITYEEFLEISKFILFEMSG